MKRVILEKPANTKTSLYSITRTTGNNVLPSPQKIVTLGGCYLILFSY